MSRSTGVAPLHQEVKARSKQLRSLLAGVASSLALGGTACSGRLHSDAGMVGAAGSGPSASGAGGSAAGSGGMTGSSGPGPGTGTGGDGANPIWEPQPCNPVEGAFAHARIWQITDEQYVNVVRDVLGIALSGIDAKIAWQPTSTDSPGTPESPPPFDDAMAAAYQSAAEKIAAKTSAKMQDLLGTTSPTRDQVQAFVLDKVSRLWRRPMSPTELSKMMGLYDSAAADGAAQGLELILQAALQWPSFLFRTELGSPASPPATSSFQLDPYELASALSFTLADTAPDDALWSKAANGTISSPDVLESEVDRLLATPTGQAKMARFASYWLGLERVPTLERNAMMFPEFSDSVKLSLYRSGLAFLQNVVQNGSVFDLLTSSRVYVDSELGSVYQIPFSGGSDLAPGDGGPDRSAGILTQPAWLSALATAPVLISSVSRGHAIQDRLLCGGDFGAIPPQPDMIGEPPPITAPEREQAETRFNTAVCRTCHSAMDPYGLTLLRFDAIGRYDASRYAAAIDDSGFVTFGWETSRDPIDTSSVVGDAMGPDLRGPLSGVGALALKLASPSPRRRVAYCAGQKITALVLGHDARVENSCQLQNAQERLYQTGSFTQFYRDLFTSPAFRTRDPG